ncbi:hypothetical protein [Hymenobacter sp.]|jgi:hypothetical protein|uniref:hypothetical protein n=1 Tax=Hymenobacter sp. TaxID=1898978 RepID=UPI002ED9D7D6
MKTPPFKLSVLVLLTLNLLLMYCSSSPTTTTTAVAQGASNASTGPDYPGGTGHTNSNTKDSIKGLTDNYARVHFPNSPKGTEDYPKVYFIDRKIISDILSQDSCIGLRIYPGYVNKSSPYKPRLIVIGVKRKPNGKLLDQKTKHGTNSLIRQECTVGETDDKCPDNCEGTLY